MTYVSKILTQMTDVFKPQQKATFALLNALMCFSGRATMRNLARYDAGSVKRLRRWASVGFQFFDLNQRILTHKRALSFDQQRLSSEHKSSRQAIIIDATFLKKSGKHTEGLGWFHNGSSRAIKKLERGLEMTLIAGINLDERAAYALDVYQTLEHSSLEMARAELTKNSKYYHQLSKYVVADGYYARGGFVSDLCAHHFEFVTLLRRDAALRYLYEGEYGGHGRPRCYAERVDYRDLSTWNRDDGLIDHKTVYSKVVNYAVWKRDLFVVVIVNETGERRVLCSTDLTLTVADVLELYGQRFQIEFLFRDAKQHTGLGHAQALDSQAQEYFANASFSALNVLRLEDRDQAILQGSSLRERICSIRSQKLRKYNKFLLNYFFSLLGESPSGKKYQEAHQRASQVGVRAA